MRTIHGVDAVAVLRRPFLRLRAGARHQIHGAHAFDVAGQNAVPVLTSVVSGWIASSNRVDDAAATWIVRDRTDAAAATWVVRDASTPRPRRGSSVTRRRCGHDASAPWPRRGSFVSRGATASTRPAVMCTPPQHTWTVPLGGRTLTSAPVMAPATASNAHVALSSSTFALIASTPADIRNGSRRRRGYDADGS